MTVSDRIRSLTNAEISTNELQTCLNTIHAQCPLSDPDGLLLCSVLLNRIIPETYLLMDRSTRKVVYELMSSKVGISQLINAIHQDSNPQNTFLFVDILISVVQHDLPYLIEQFFESKGTGLESWKSILSVKVVDSLGSVLIWLLDHPDAPERLSADLDRSNIKRIMEQYAEKCTSLILQLLGKDRSKIELNKLQVIRQLINSFLSKEPDQVINSLFLNWESCLSLFSEIETSNLKQIYLFEEAQKNFIVGLLQAMSYRIDENNLEIYNTWFQFVRNVTEKVQCNDMHDIVLSSCEKSSNIVVSSIWMKCSGSPSFEWAKNVMDKFGNKDYIMNTGINSQKDFTKFLVMTLTLMSNEQLEKLSSEIPFLNSITSRLESKGTTTSELGMIVADYIYNRINGKVMFNIPSYNFKREAFMEIFCQIDSQFLKLSAPLPTEKLINDIMQHVHSDQATGPTDGNVVPVTPLIVEMNYNSDNEDSDLDDPSIGRRPTVAKPVFLKDLLHYLTSDPQKDTATYDKKGIAFSIGIEMVRMKSGSAELRYYSAQLLDAALDLDSVGFPLKEDEQFDEDQIKVAFDSWRLSFMIAICTSEPDLIFRYLLQNFVKQDWNVPTRIQVLTCIGLSCRELCGKEDTFIWGKSNPEKVALGTLTGPGHDLFRALDTNQYQKKKIVDVEQEKREIQLVEALEAVGIGKGTILRRSRKLELDKEKKNSELVQGRTLQTSFINKKLPALYFSMTAIWQQVNAHTYGRGFNVGTMSEYLNSHFLDIIAMVHSCGIPSSIELIDMSIEQISIISGQLQTLRTHTGGEFPSLLLKAVVNSLRLLLIDNDRTFSVLRSTAVLEITTLCEIFAQVIHDAPPMEEPTRIDSVYVLQQLQAYCLYDKA